MATKPVPNAATSEKALRKRIHHIFCGDGPPVTPPTTPPRFWVGPTKKQKDAVFMDIIEESTTLSDRIDLHTEAQTEERIPQSNDIEAHTEAQVGEQRWLNSPHVDLGGKSPEEMLTGGDPSRQRLGRFVAAIEAAVRSGSFS